MQRRTALALAASCLAMLPAGCGSSSRPLVQAGTHTASAVTSPTLRRTAPPRSPGARTARPTPNASHTRAVSLAGVDLLNTTYRTGCLSTDGTVASVRVHHGRATNRFGDVFTVRPPVYGDLTGDRVPDAAVVLSCARATAGPDNVAVFAASADGPRLIGTPLDDRANESVQSLHITAGTLVIVATGYTRTAPQCCPDLSIRSSYRWDGHRLLRSGVSVTPLSGG